jgi:hypothetical protein
MIAPYKLRIGTRSKEARRLFDDFSDRNAFMADEKVDLATPRINFGRLYAFACNPEPSLDPEVSAALKKDVRLAAHFCRIVESCAIANLPRVAAADTNSITIREGNGCRVWLEPSEAEPDQVYLIIKLSGPDVKPKNMILFDEGLYKLSHSLPPARNGTIQLLFQHDDELIEALSRPKSEVYFS